MNNIEKPKHYQLKGLEPYESIDVIKAVLGKYIKYFYIGNILKYSIRAEKKNGLEDYKKANVYLEWLIEWESLTEEEKEQNLREIEEREIKQDIKEIEEQIENLEIESSRGFLKNKDTGITKCVLVILNNQITKLKDKLPNNKQLEGLEFRLREIETRFKGEMW